ncbi:sulfatase [Halorussus halophilus]|uniref:sulfatase n=1 Tax=Halorussus halophilus TaxID=2650975 RepID=UPI001300E194|nr:sulfatase [Halorussus halophilus]
MSEIQNVLLISIDCLRADRFGEAIDSGLVPTFASLQNSGTSFESAFTVANTTDPSLTSFMTSDYPFAHGVVQNGWGLDESKPVGAEKFREAGYDTFGVVSVDHLNHEHSKLGRGFDRYFDDASYDTLYPILSRIYDTKLFNTIFGAVKNLGTQRYNVKNLLRDLGLIQLHCRTGRSVTDDAIEGLERADSPFFGWVHYFDMHEPRNAPRKWLGDHDEYTAAMMHVDELVGELLKALEARGLREETLIVLTGDHGEALDDHGYTGHGRTLYDEELHVPLVFDHDSLPDGGVERQVRTIDILPTLLSLADAEQLEAPGEPLFDDGPVETDRRVFAMAYPEFANAVAVRKDGWKLVRNRDSDEERLYDLEADPHEREDVSERERERRTDLAADLDEWLVRFEETGRQEVDSETEEMLADLGYKE